VHFLQGCSKRLYDEAAGSLNSEAYCFSTLRWANDRERSQRPSSCSLRRLLKKAIQQGRKEWGD
jgi:hypothetical protein